jgi:hypothetical protein
MADSGEKPTGFTVTDRRSFDTSGERREDAPEAKGAQPGSEAPKPDAAGAARSGAQRPLPPADFATLVLSLGSSAIMYLGEGGESPEGKPAERNLPMAKQAIDLLNVLEEKTKGNLSSDEQHILESLLFDLRLRYVEALKASPAGA